jgi:hypothetical protein
MTNPPVKGEPSFELYQKEKDHILSTFREIGAKWVKELNHIPGINCSIVEGGPVVFPRVGIGYLRKRFWKMAKTLLKNRSVFLRKP